MSTPQEILARFGGVDALAATLEIPPSTIRNWSAGGVPGKWHSRLLILARERDVDLSVDELLETASRG